MKSTLALIACFSVAALSAQTPQLPVSQKGTVRLHLTGGVSFSNLLNSEAPHKIDVDMQQTIKQDYNTSFLKDMRIAPAMGISVEYFLADNVSIKVGLNSMQKGINLKSNLIEQEQNSNYESKIVKRFERKIKNSYLEIPIVLRTHFNNNFYLQAGGYAAVLTGSKMTSWNLYESEYIYYNPENHSSSQLQWEQDFKDKNKKYTTNLDFGISVGGGLNFPLQSGWFLSADLLVNIGLVRIDNKYDNQYEVIPIASAGNTTNYLITNTNYYGLNSDAKNFSAALTFGIGHSF